ncbi:hypothetical protein BOTBODRAFT_180967 [Botryobasidium botryosum FD-172 SS1]|uniref:STAS domain-containing protein n=1 Tax=Botryobasidium botryosum (strain FD-172 SS1) TaxID=930990 RepID=A0A067LXR2_BOTB1|nr:hypothetical protein BOTBODRAFT_180967 [Botryobasidium botryosum FD-172 SS1]
MLLSHSAVTPAHLGAYPSHSPHAYMNRPEAFLPSRPQGQGSFDPAARLQSPFFASESGSSFSESSILSDEPTPPTPSPVVARSGISLLLAAREGPYSPNSRPHIPGRRESQTFSRTADHISEEDEDDDSHSTSTYGSHHPADTESAALLSPPGDWPSYGSRANGQPKPNNYPSYTNPFVARWHAGVVTARKLARPQSIFQGVRATAEVLPAVFLGLLLNILDGVSYGYIIFPVGAIFSGFGGLGVSMFFVSTIISQLVYSFGGSYFGGGNGSMMIEVIPFFHLLIDGIIRIVGEDNPEQVIATTMVAFALSSVLTGMTFMLFGALKLGAIVGFFPRHILIGCIGGVGVFLIETGFEVAAGLNQDGFVYDLDTLKHLFTNPHVLSMWVPALALAVLLRVITHRFHHQLIFPLYFVSIGCIFYLVIAIGHLDISALRSSGWIFDVGDTNVPWWTFYTHFGTPVSTSSTGLDLTGGGTDLQQTRWDALLATLPTQFALLFFNILHPPLNIPSLAVSLNEDQVDVNRELVAHGISNMAAGFLGTVPNYLAYLNSLLFYRVGGGSRYSGFLLAMATGALLLIGTGPISFIPVMLVGALIFVLGLDLVKEALWDTRHRVSTTEYITILSIVVVMTGWDFVVGVFLGIILACFFFVAENSRRKCIRAVFTGASAMSTVRRPSAHREYLRDVGIQTSIVKVQGFLFWGTIAYLEEIIRRIFDVDYLINPIRFLVLDLSLVAGIDVSAAEAFVRVQRMISRKNVGFVLCGFTPDSPIGKALQSVDLWSESEDNVHVFLSLNEALEWTENAYLRAWFTGPGGQQKLERPTTDTAITLAPPSTFNLSESFANSPRRTHIHSAGERLMPPAANSVPIKDEPFNTLLKTFSSYAELPDEFYIRLTRYFKPIVVPEREVLFRQGEDSNALYVVESGVLRAVYSFADHIPPINESMVAGTLIGELSALSGTSRNATVFAERQSVLWKLTLDELVRMETEYPETARIFMRLVLKTAKIDYDVLIAALASGQ